MTSTCGSLVSGQILKNGDQALLTFTFPGPRKDQGTLGGKS